MARITHIAIATNDAKRSCEFYTQVFGLEFVRALDSQKFSGFVLSDGHMNLTIPDFKDDDAAGSELGVTFQGLHHIGVQVDPSEHVEERLTAAGYALRRDINEVIGVKAGGNHTPSHEFKYQGPDGVVIDISSVGWEGTESWQGRR